MATALEEGKAVEVNEVDVATTAASGEAVELTAVERYLGATDEKVTARKVAFEALCGLSVSLAMVPEAVSFSFVAGVKPVVGMTAGWIVAAVTSLAGGRPAMICGATGAIAALVPTARPASRDPDPLPAREKPCERSRS